MNFDVSPWSGLLLPAAGRAPTGNWTTAGLVVPDLSVTAARLGLARAGTSSAWFEEYVKAYVTAADYLSGPMAGAGLPYDPAPLIRDLLLMHSREDYLPVLVALTTPHTARS